LLCGRAKSLLLGFGGLNSRIKPVFFRKSIQLPSSPTIITDGLKIVFDLLLLLLAKDCKDKGKGEDL
jgi:hypothetical protein